MSNELTIFNYYDMLNVTITASFAEVRKNYKQIALATHPDKNNNNIEANLKMQQLNDAKRILTDEILRRDYDHQLFLQCLKKGDYETTNFFLNNKLASLKINEKDNTGSIPLHYACLFNFFDSAAILIKYGKPTNINKKDDCGNTPLHYAVAAGDVKLVKLLISKDADLKIKNNLGFDCLTFAQQLNDDIYGFLLELLEKETIKENKKILLNMEKRIIDIEKDITNIKEEILYFEGKKINIMLNFVIGIFSFGCINKNKSFNEGILDKNNQLKNLLSKRDDIDNAKKDFEKKIRKSNFNKTRKINIADAKNQASTSRRQSLNLSDM